MGNVRGSESQVVGVSLLAAEIMGIHVSRTQLDWPKSVYSRITDSRVSVPAQLTIPIDDLEWRSRLAGQAVAMAAVLESQDREVDAHL